MALNPSTFALMARRFTASITARNVPLPREAYAWLMSPDGVVPGVPRTASREEAIGYPPFERCLDLIASGIAAVSLVAGRIDKDAGVWIRLPDQPAVLTDPYPTAGGPADVWQWRYAAVRDLLEFGNHFAWLGDMDYRTGRPAWLLPLPARDVAVMDDGRGGWSYLIGAQRLDPSQVLHISRGNISGELLGRGLLDQFGRSLRISITAEEWAGRYLEGGGLPPAIIQSQATLTPDQGAEFKTKWRDMMATGEALMLPANVTITPLVSDAQRQQLVEARQWDAQMACIMTGVPSYMLGLPGPTMTYQNVETADIAYRAYTLDRWAQPIKHAFDKHLMPNGTVCRWMWNQLERTDSQTQVNIVGTKLDKGIISTDEARQELSYPPAEISTDPGTTPQGVPELTAQEGS